MAIELLIFPIALTLFYLTLSTEWNDLGLFGISYLFSSLWLSPDLDLHRNIARNRWGILGWIWRPYSMLFKHRGLSHHFLLGPLTRLIYLGILLTILVYVCVRFGLFSVYQLSEILDARALFVVVIGIYVPNLIHIISDGMPVFKLNVRKNQK